MTSQTPCVLYESKFKVSDLDTQKIENVVNRTVRNKKIPVFSSVHGIEGLFHVIDKFNKAATRLQLQDQTKWDTFEDALDRVAESKWENQISNIADVDKTDQRFDVEIQKFVKSYSQDDNARDVLIKYLKEKCKKPYKVSPQDHADRMETLISIANRLEGTEPQIDVDNAKKIIFESFPPAWQYSFRRSKELNTTDIPQLISFMTLCKCEADETDDRKAKKQKVDRIRGGDGKKDKRKNKTIEADQECPIHGHHKWGECSLNPRSQNFGLRMSGGRFQNSGRGNQGRGRGGRFNNNNNNSGNNYYSGGRNNYNSQGRGRGRNNHSTGQGNSFNQGTGSSFNRSNQQNDQYYNRDETSVNNNTQSNETKSVSWANDQYYSTTPDGDNDRQNDGKGSTSVKRKW